MFISNDHLGFHAPDGRFQKPQDRSILHFLHYLVENCYYDSTIAALAFRAKEEKIERGIVVCEF